MVKKCVNVRLSSIFIWLTILSVSIPAFAAQELLSGLNALPSIYNMFSRTRSLVEAGSNALVSSDPHAPASQRGLIANVQRSLAHGRPEVQWAMLGVILKERTEDLALYAAEYSEFLGRVREVMNKGALFAKNHPEDGDQEEKLNNRLRAMTRCYQATLEAFVNFRENPQLSTAQQAAYFLQASKRLSEVNAGLLPPDIAHSLRKERKNTRPALTNFFARQSPAGLIDLHNKGFFDYECLYDSDYEDGAPKTTDECSIHEYMTRETHRLERAGSEPSLLRERNKRLRAASVSKKPVLVAQNLKQAEEQEGEDSESENDGQDDEDEKEGGELVSVSEEQ